MVAALLLAPLGGALVLACLPRKHIRLLRWSGIALAFVPLLLLGQLWLQSSDIDVHEWERSWIEWVIASSSASELTQSIVFSMPLKLSMAQYTAPFVLLTIVVFIVAAWTGFMVPKRWKTFYVLLLLLEFGVLGTFMARDVFLFFMFFELSIIPMFLLIGLFGRYGRERAATTFLVYNGFGSALLLLGLIALVAYGGYHVVSNGDGTMPLGVYTSHFEVILANIMAGNVAQWMPEWTAVALFWLFVVAFGIKIPLFPLHTWMLRVHGEAHPAVVIVHSGVLLKMGAYGLLLFGWMLFPEQVRESSSALVLIAVIGIIFGAVMACAQRDFRNVFAYGSLSHMGIAFLGMASFDAVGVQGALFQFISHGLIVALLFYLVAVIEARTQTTELQSLGGLAQPMPFFAAMLLLASLAAMGLPGLSGFVGEWLVFVGSFEQWPVLTVIACASVVLSAIYLLRVVLGATYGAVTQRFASLQDVRGIELFPLVLTASLIILLGIYPAVLTERSQATTNKIVQVHSNVESCEQPVDGVMDAQDIMEKGC